MADEVSMSTSLRTIIKERMMRRNPEYRGRVTKARAAARGHPLSAAFVVTRVLLGCEERGRSALCVIEPGDGGYKNGFCIRAGMRLQLGSHEFQTGRLQTHLRVR